jgi:hypothetical protein
MLVTVVYRELPVVSSACLWPNSEAQVELFSVSFREIAALFWKKLENFGFSSIHQQ